MITIGMSNTSTKYNKYVANHKGEHFDDIGFREPAVRIIVLFYYKVRFVPPNNKICRSTMVIMSYKKSFLKIPKR